MTSEIAQAVATDPLAALCLLRVVLCAGGAALLAHVGLEYLR